MKREENRAVRMVGANGVTCIATYDNEDGLLMVTIQDAKGDRIIDVPGPLFLQAHAMTVSTGRYGAATACADHGVHDGWDCPVCHPPKPQETKSLPEAAPGPADLAASP
jgi:hypothetical protein